MTYERIHAALAPLGLIARGGFHAKDSETLPDNAKTVVMVGNAGPAMWRVFSEATTAQASHPLDTWTQEVLTPFAKDFGCSIVFPFDGPPYHPFQQWAARSDNVAPSPIGPLIHPTYGLWHAYRAALLFDKTLDLPTRRESASPCDTCVEKPCLGTCPVSAFSIGKYNVPACRQHIATDNGSDCLQSGCLARRACPIGQDYIYAPEQAEFHMRHFLNA